MFSDFIVDQQPISVEQAIAEYQKISSYLGSRDDNYTYSVPMKAVLIPISQVCKAQSHKKYNYDGTIDADFFLWLSTSWFNLK